MYTEQWALDQAIRAAQESPCAKSQRGVVLWRRATGERPGLYLGAGFDHPPAPFTCDRSVACRGSCSKLCIHAAEDLLLKIPTTRRRWDLWSLQECEMLHIKVENGHATPSGQPTCWQCSRLILGAKLKAMWLLHREGLRSYTPEEFHRTALKNSSLPALGNAI